MHREITITADGTATVYIPEMNVTYHSKFGALQESLHVFIQTGLAFYHAQTGKKQLSVFEMGLGTGLNSMLTVQYADQQDLDIYYEALERYPLSGNEVAGLNYTSFTNTDSSLLNAIHMTPWEEEISITKNFRLKKVKKDLQTYQTDHLFDIIYYDAFAPEAQPELWTEDIFQKLYDMLHSGGILVTYCSKSIVRRALQSVGFEVSKIPGPPGKREILRARK